MNRLTVWLILIAHMARHFLDDVEHRYPPPVRGVGVIPWSPQARGRLTRDLAALPGWQMGLPFFNDRCGSLAELRSD